MRAPRFATLKMPQLCSHQVGPGAASFGHLIGFAAECAIKLKILNLRPQNNSPHGHFPDLLIAARKHLGARANFSNMYDILKGDVFAGWNVNRRYYETGNTSNSELALWFSGHQAPLRNRKAEGA